MQIYIQWQSGCDGCSGKIFHENDSKDGNYPQLEFKHLLTQLVIKAVAEDEAAIAKWGKLTDITLTKVGKNNPSGAVTVSLSAGTADESSAFATLLDNGMSFWVRGAGTETAFASQAKELTTDGEEVAYSMVAPLKMRPVRQTIHWL